MKSRVYDPKKSIPSSFSGNRVLLVSMIVKLEGSSSGGSGSAFEPYAENLTRRKGRKDQEARPLVPDCSQG